jgi:hypothetical protein
VGKYEDKLPVRERLPRLYNSDDDAWFDDETDRNAVERSERGEAGEEEDDEPTIRRTNVRALIDIVDELEVAFGRSA